jgi:hypothetical protein
VVLPDGTTHTVYGYLHVQCKIQGFTGQISISVIDLITFDLVLGDSWLRSRSALIDFGAGCLTVWKQTQKFRLQAELRDGKPIYAVKLPDPPALPTSVPTNSAEPMFLSAMQAKRAITQQGCASFLVYVSLQDGATAESSPPPPPEQTPESDIQMRFSSSTTGTDLEINLRAVLHDFKDVFATELPTGVPQDRNAFETIPLEPGAVPPYRPMYRLSPLEREEVER